MSTTVTIEEAQARLRDLIASLAPGDELVITENNRPVAAVRNVEPALPHPVFGRGRGQLLYDANDDTHLDDFREYME